jgi:LacI family transcriptional regulator
MVPVSQRHIAKELDLSVATVSRCLRQDSSIPAETRARVLTLASRMGYRPKEKDPNVLLNERLEKGKPSLVLAAFVQADDLQAEENTFRVVAGMSKAAHEIGASLILHNIPFAKNGAIHLTENQPELMRAGKVQGVILVNVFGQEAVEKLATQVTCVGVDVQYANLRIDYVGEENIGSMGKVLAHLTELGHRKIGFVSFPSWISTLEERLAGYILGLMNRGLPVRQEYILGWRERKGGGDDFLQIRRWIEDGVTALVCANDGVAIDVYRWLRDNGYRCPEDVSITGFDRRSLPGDVPALTTFAVHFQDLGRLAVERLATRLKQPILPPTRLTIECELVAGQSTGPGRCKCKKDVL